MESEELKRGRRTARAISAQWGVGSGSVGATTPHCSTPHCSTDGPRFNTAWKAKSSNEGEGLRGPSVHSGEWVVDQWALPLPTAALPTAPLMALDSILHGKRRAQTRAKDCEGHQCTVGSG